MNCIHTHLDLIRNLTQRTHFYENSLCLDVLSDSYSVLSRCMCVRGRGGGGLPRHFDGGVCCVAETFTLYSYKGEVRKAYSKHDNYILFV